MPGFIESAISKVAAMVGVDRNALERLIYNESRGNPFVGMDSSNYSAGIGQISRTVWRTYSKLPYSAAADAKYYQENMIVAAKYLKDDYVQFGTWTEALEAYNMGPTALRKAEAGLRNIPFITQKYVRGFRE